MTEIVRMILKSELVQREAAITQWEEDLRQLSQRAATLESSLRELRQQRDDIRQVLEEHE